MIFPCDDMVHAALVLKRLNISHEISRHVQAFLCVPRWKRIMVEIMRSRKKSHAQVRWRLAFTKRLLERRRRFARALAMEISGSPVIADLVFQMSWHSRQISRTYSYLTQY